MLYKITEIEDEILKEDNILNSTLKELKRYKGEKSYFNKEIGEEAIKFLNESIKVIEDLRIGNNTGEIKIKNLENLLIRLKKEYDLYEKNEKTADISKLKGGY